VTPGFPIFRSHCFFPWFFRQAFSDPGPSSAGRHISLACAATASKENDNEQTRPYFLEKT
jgi:hypothetical protein